MKTQPDQAGSAAQSDTPNLDLLIERASWYPPLDRDAVLREVGTLRAENARLREGLILIQKGETTTFDENLNDFVHVSMDMEEARQIALVALINCTCCEVFGENPKCVAHGSAVLATGGAEKPVMNAIEQAQRERR